MPVANGTRVLPLKRHTKQKPKMAKAKLYNDNVQYHLVGIYCPGCKVEHLFTIKHPGPFVPWNWNGSLDNPTFTPSMLCSGGPNNMRCHSFVTDGKIQFLNDCDHELKNQTVDLPEIKKQN